MYLREADLLPHLDQWLASLFDPDHLDDTLDALQAASYDHADLAEQLRAAEQAIANAQRQLNQYRAALGAGADPTEVTAWINQATAAVGVLGRVGLEVLQLLMEEDVTALAGVKGRHDPARRAVRHGYQDGWVSWRWSACWPGCPRVTTGSGWSRFGSQVTERPRATSRSAAGPPVHRLPPDRAGPAAGRGPVRD